MQPRYPLTSFANAADSATQLMGMALCLWYSVPCEIAVSRHDLLGVIEEAHSTLDMVFVVIKEVIVIVVVRVTACKSEDTLGLDVLR